MSLADAKGKQRRSGKTKEPSAPGPGAGPARRKGLLSCFVLEGTLREAESPLLEAESARRPMATRMKRLQVGDLVTAEARIIFSDGRAPYRL